MAELNDYKVLVTDYVWPSTEPEREVLSSIGATIIEAPDQSESTLILSLIHISEPTRPY